MDDYFLPIALVILASVFQGTFGLGMKYTKPLAWEAWWLVHATVAMLIFPLAWALIVVPDLFSAIAASPGNELIAGSLLGFLWGIGGIMFGVSVGYIGVSLTYGIVMGLCSLAGALIPLFLRFGNVNPASLPYIFIGLALLAIAVVIVTVAGLKRDKKLAEANTELEGIKKGAAFRTGLIIACVCGLLSAMLAVGFDKTEAVGDSAEFAISRAVFADEGVTVDDAVLKGISDADYEVPDTVPAEVVTKARRLHRNSALARWVVVLAGAYLMNAGYAVFLLMKNKSWGSFGVTGGFVAYKWSVIAGLLWFAALGVYGQSVALMGELGTVICWPVLLGLSLIVSNAVAVVTGEWKGMGGPLKLMLVGVGVIILATVVMTYASTLEKEEPADNPPATALVVPVRHVP